MTDDTGIGQFVTGTWSTAAGPRSRVALRRPPPLNMISCWRASGATRPSGSGITETATSQRWNGSWRPPMPPAPAAPSSKHLTSPQKGLFPPASCCTRTTSRPWMSTTAPSPPPSPKTSNHGPGCSRSADPASPNWTPAETARIIKDAARAAWAAPIRPTGISFPSKADAAFGKRFIGGVDFQIQGSLPLVI